MYWYMLILAGCCSLYKYCYTYWLFRINQSFLSMRNDFNFLCHLNFEIWLKSTNVLIFYFFQRKIIITRVKPILIQPARIVCACTKITCLPISATVQCMGHLMHIFRDCGRYYLARYYMAQPGLSNIHNWNKRGLLFHKVMNFRRTF